MDADARRLAEAHSLSDLEALLAQAEEACALADQEAQDRPSPQALGQYRSAARALAAAKQALSIARDSGLD